MKKTTILLLGILLMISQTTLAQKFQKTVMEGLVLGGNRGHDQTIYPFCVNENINDPVNVQMLAEKYKSWNVSQINEFNKTLKLNKENNQLAVGDRHLFYVSVAPLPGRSVTGNFNTNFDTVYAELRRAGPKVEVWVSLSEVNKAHIDTSSVPAAMLNDLEYSTPIGSKDPSKGIKVLDDAFFGNPPNYGPGGPGTGSGKTTFLICDIHDGRISGDPYVAGFFYSWDQTINPQSNQRDILYIDSDPGIYNGVGMDPTRPLPTVAHEYQHLIFYGFNGPISGATFINEGLSEYAPVICGYGFDSPGGYMSNTDVSLFPWNGLLSDYDRARAFTTYLCQQAGDTVSKKIVQSGGIDMPRYDAALAAKGYVPPSGVNMFKNFAVANVVQNTSVDPLFGYPGGYSFTKPAFSGNFSDPNQTQTGLTIEAYGVDYVRFYSGSNLTINVSNTSTSTSGLAVKVVKIGQSTTTVSDLTPLGTDVNFSDFGTTSDKELIFVLINTTGSQINYSYTSTGTITDFYSDLINDENTGTIWYSLSQKQRVIAVKFQSPIYPAKIKSTKINLYNGNPIKIYIYNTDISGNPSSLLTPPFTITPTGVSTSFYDIDLSALNINISKDFYIGCQVSVTPSSNGILLDTAAPIHNVSFQIDTTTLALTPTTSGDWVIRATVNVNDTVKPQIKAGLFQNPVFTEKLTIILTANKSLRNTSGTYYLDGVPSSLTLTSDANNAQDYTQIAYKDLTNSGTVKVKVQGTNKFGFVSGADSIQFPVTKFNPSIQGTITSSDGIMNLVLPANSLSKESFITILTKKETQTLPKMGNEKSIPLSDQYQVGPVGLSLLVPAYLTIQVSPTASPEKMGIGIYQNGQWQYVPSKYQNGILTAEITKLGTYQARQFEDKELIPTSYKLSQNYPNPFNPTTLISYDLPEQSYVVLTVYDILGQKVKTLVNGQLAPGTHLAEWDGKNDRGLNVGSGVYFYKIQTQTFRQIKKMTYIR